MDKMIEKRLAVLEAEFARIAGEEKVRLTFPNEKVMTISFEGRNDKAMEKLIELARHGADVVGSDYNEYTNESYIWVKFPE